MNIQKRFTHKSDNQLQMEPLNFICCKCKGITNGDDHTSCSICFNGFCCECVKDMYEDYKDPIELKIDTTTIMTVFEEKEICPYCEFTGDRKDAKKKIIKLETKYRTQIAENPGVSQLIFTLKTELRQFKNQYKSARLYMRAPCIPVRKNTE